MLLNCLLFSEFLLYRKWHVRDRQVIRKSLKFIAEKNIKAHAFAPNGCWQAILTGLGGIYILPVKTLLVRVRRKWRRERERKKSGKRERGDRKGKSESIVCGGEQTLCDR